LICCRKKIYKSIAVLDTVVRGFRRSLYAATTPCLGGVRD